MKKKIIYAAVVLLIAAGFNSCEGLKNCKTCRYNTYVDGVLTTSELQAEYCDADLIARQAAPDAVVGNMVTKFECDN